MLNLFISLSVVVVVVVVVVGVTGLLEGAVKSMQRNILREFSAL